MIVKTRLIPRRFDAITFWPCIFVRPEHRGDAALIEHELVHYREQRWITPLWVLRYLLSRKFRLAAEVRAYQRQIALGGITYEQAANMLMHYQLGVTFAQALQSLNGVNLSDDLHVG